VATTLDPAKKGVGIDLVDGNLAVQSQLLNWGSESWAFATTAIPADAKQYVEFKADNADARTLFVGAGDGTDRVGTLAAGICYRTDRAWWISGAYAGDLTRWATGDVVMMAADAIAGKVWFGVNGAWSNGDPAAGTGGIVYAIAGLFFGCGAFVHTTDGPQKITARFAAADQSYSAPAGFTAVDAPPAGVAGALAALEAAADTASIAGGVAVRGTFAAAESGQDAATLAGGVAVTGSLAGGETGGDSAGLAGRVRILGGLGAIEAGADGAAIAGQVIVSGAILAAETGQDTASFRGAEPDTITGSLAAAESGADSGSIAGSARVRGLLAAGEAGADSASAAGRVRISGQFAAIEAANDNAAMLGGLRVSGVLAASATGADSASFTAAENGGLPDLSGTGRWLAARAAPRTLMATAQSRIIHAR